MAAQPRDATRSASSPKLRTPITGLARLLLTSSTGAMLQLAPSPRSCRMVISEARRAFSGSAVAASAMAPGTFTASWGSLVTMPPSWSMMIKAG